MPEPVCAQMSPFAVTLEEGRKYAWCACGRSASQPMCDGSHKGTGFSPVIFTAERTETGFLCGCKHGQPALLRRLAFELRGSLSALAWLKQG
ncbi:MAG TPA: CDGSH iron-sulfur domain-containing protein [Rhodospirillales bacterium]|nr:CDGSH iron-sulfur domain-containing protein [Rhodospirillales bacterium]